MARALTDKGYCATKGIHYYGLKVHVIARRKAGTLPLPEFIGLSQASVHELTAMRPVFMSSRGRVFIGDKAYEYPAPGQAAGPGAGLRFTYAHQKGEEHAWGATGV